MTLKQKTFVKRYIEYNGNATETVRNVYDVKSNNSAAVIGSRLLRNVKVIREINSISEAEKDFPMLIVELLKNVLQNGTGKEQVEAIKIDLKLHGLY